ncbi:MAG: Swt1 family HEPN domain-containing protein [Planctomycetota bacterium]|nr:Swt1 family HEPN domain-containing protein [Planctomycetota bacterium]
MTTNRKDVRDWMFRGLMFEADAERFRTAGIRVGADQRDAERSLLEETLAPFGVDERDEALRMARLYALIYCFENAVRSLIAERLGERHGSDWWVNKVPEKIRQFAEQRQKESTENSWLEGQKKDPMGFIQFGHLADIITNNWTDFADLVPTQHFLKQRFDEMEKARNFIAHNRLLMPGEFARLEMYVADWNRQVGL